MVYKVNQTQPGKPFSFVRRLPGPDESKRKIPFCQWYRLKGFLFATDCGTSVELRENHVHGLFVINVSSLQLSTERHGAVERKLFSKHKPHVLWNNWNWFKAGALDISYRLVTHKKNCCVRHYLGLQPCFTQASFFIGVWLIATKMCLYLTNLKWISLICYARSTNCWKNGKLQTLLQANLEKRIYVATITVFLLSRYSVPQFIIVPTIESLPKWLASAKKSSRDNSR